MARSIGIFVALLASAAVLIGAIAWWLGPNLVHLALFHPQRAEPFTLLSFARGLQPDVYAARYRGPLTGLAESEGGVLVDDYRLSHQLEGERQHGWQYLMRLHMGEGRKVVQVTTSSPYRMLVQDLPGLEFQLAGSFAAAQENWRPVLALWLLQPHETDLDQAADPLAPVLEQLPLGPGRVVWDAELVAIEPDLPWQRLVAVDFPDEKAALAWLRNPDVSTARSLSNARVRNLTLAVFTRQRD